MIRRTRLTMAAAVVSVGAVACAPLAAQAVNGHSHHALDKKKVKHHKKKHKPKTRIVHVPGPTVTVTAPGATVTLPGTSTTTTATATVTPTYTAPALVWNQGTALLKETNPDGSAIKPYGWWDGVPLSGTAYGSAFTADPNHPGVYYGLTDRGPNVAYPDGSSLHKLEPLPGFQDQIGKFHFVNGTAVLDKVIGLTTADGEAYGGLENSVASAGETIYDMYGDALPSSKAGMDTEGIVVMPDGTFWISDEYGPLITHFDAAGKQIGQLSPYDGSLPAELKLRNANKGMEGLTLTPDGQYLVGMMQSSLNNDSTSATGMITRIVKIKLSDLSVQEYLYSLHDAVNPTTTKAYEGEANSEITAVSNTQLLVDERDGKFEGQTSGKQKADKNLFKIDLTGATDVGPSSPLIGNTIAGGAVTWDAAKGLLVGGQSIEKLVGTRSGLASPSNSGWQTTAGAPTAGGAVGALTTAGITPVSESLFLNYAGLVSSIDPTGMYFGHDKVEGVTIDPTNPSRLYISNDSDFGITDLPLASAGGYVPTADHRAKGTDAEKFLPDGKTQDFGEVMEVEMTQVPSAYKG